MNSKNCKTGFLISVMVLASHSFALSPKIEIEYPVLAVRNCIEGRVEVSFSIRPDGHIENAKVLSTTNVIFVNSALDAARNLYYPPEHLNEVNDNVTFMFTFKLDTRTHKHCFGQSNGLE